MGPCNLALRYPDWVVGVVVSPLGVGGVSAADLQPRRTCLARNLVSCGTQLVPPPLFSFGQPGLSLTTQSMDALTSSHKDAESRSMGLPEAGLDSESLKGTISCGLEAVSFHDRGHLLLAAVTPRFADTGPPRHLSAFSLSP